MRTTNIVLIKICTAYTLRREAKFVFKPKVRDVAKVRRLIPLQIAQHPSYSQAGFSVNLSAQLQSNLGEVAITFVAYSCPFARGKWMGCVPVCLPYRLGQQEGFWTVTHKIHTLPHRDGLGAFVCFCFLHLCYA